MAKILGAHIPLEPKNLAINGALDYWQRVETTTTTINTATAGGGYTADMFGYFSSGSTVKNFSVAQSSNVPTLAQSGFESTFSYLYTQVTGIVSFAASDYILPIFYKMEGLDYERIHTKTVTFGFWAYATVAGTYSFALQNAAGTRSYVTTFSIAAATTWQFIPITVTLDQTGTWLFTNAVGLEINIGAVSGSTAATSTLGSWQAGGFVAASTGTNWMSTASNVLQIAQFSIVEGSLGLGATGFLRAGKSIQQELAMCQRYYEKSYDIGTAVGTTTNNGIFQCGDIGSSAGAHTFAVNFRTTKRADPTVGIWSIVGVSANVTATGSSGSTITFGPNQAASAGTTAIGINGFYGVANSYSNSSPGQTLGHFTADAGL